MNRTLGLKSSIFLVSLFAVAAPFQASLKAQTLASPQATLPAAPAPQSAAPRGSVNKPIPEYTVRGVQTDDWPRTLKTTLLTST